MAEPVGSHTKVVVVRLYKSRLDWDYVREARVSCDIYGRLDLEEVRKQLGVQEKCRVSWVTIIYGIKDLTFRGSCLTHRINGLSTYTMVLLWIVETSSTLWKMAACKLCASQIMCSIHRFGFPTVFFCRIFPLQISS